MSKIIMFININKNHASYKGLKKHKFFDISISLPKRVEHYEKIVRIDNSFVIWTVELAVKILGMWSSNHWEDELPKQASKNLLDIDPTMSGKTFHNSYF